MKSNLLLLLAAVIWGLAFVAQRVSMDYIGPFTFSGVRFALGSLSLLPLIFFCKINPHNSNNSIDNEMTSSWRIGFIAGIIIFFAISLQQVGLQYTAIGKASFITSLYIVIVPIMGIFLQQHITTKTWCGCMLATTGLYLLCVKEGFAISYGDLLELIGAFFWAAHLLFIDHFAKKVDTLQFAFLQFMSCSLLSIVTALLIEPIALDAILQARVPILYTGICSTAIAYTLQIVGQKHAEPSHAAIILSMETVIATLGGYIFLNERLGFYELLGCTLMLSGVLLAQLQGRKSDPKQSKELNIICKKTDAP
ncbi:DMT family transporter [Sporomusa acidovorans]|uniref:EamA domain-containing protein n=1 Tax=Sporomusa acidovorans (strain ATCC 49682 / DSM 3132 / Mol) TaxID=1123286 RepID=A0ABZ3J448_SPOA4|nr:DMT family transporter [Sporomusa acidovorans]OZC15549.1 putative DMT superfamily transporter inner membrane protein [Sporomusa acidovorans DSM 3132]SDE17800.1 Permease of the drug/metabolite transporter (DMT) superfamily [Sporomusa acidovorans]